MKTSPVAVGAPAPANDRISVKELLKLATVAPLPIPVSI
jgi:hypothetical protein